MDRAYISIIGEVGEQVRLEDVVAQTNMHREASELVFLISGPGGDADEGEAIANHIANLRQRTITKNIGDIASIDASIYLAGDHRIWDKSKGQFLIHNPWMQAEGDAAEFKKASDHLAEYENRIAKFISKQTGLDAEATKALMSRDEFLDNNNLVSLGIAHEVIESEFKAVAKYKQKKVEMNDVEVKEKLGLLDAIMAKLEKVFPSKVKAIVLQDAAGTEIDFPDVEQGVDPVEGDMATVDGKAADGPFVMPDGKTYVFAVGKLVEIKPAEGEDDMEALKQKITELEGQLAEASATATESTDALAAAKTDFEAQAVEFKTALDEVKALVKSDTKPPKAGEKPKAKKGEGEEKIRVGFKQIEKK